MTYIYIYIYTHIFVYLCISNGARRQGVSGQIAILHTQSEVICL